VADFSFRDLLEERAGRAGSRPFFTFDRRAWTTGEMDACANRLANALRQLGLGPRDHVAVMLPNGPEIVWCWWGLAKLGAVYVLVNTQLLGESLAHVLTHSDATALIVDGSLLPAVAALDPWPSALRQVVVAAEVGPGPRPPAAVHTLDALMAQSPAGDAPGIDERRGDPALIIYTSGTTGRPKGVLWSRQAQTDHARRYAAELNCAEAGESVYTCLPLFHVTSMGVTISSYLRGARVAVDRRFDPFAHWRRIREEDAVLFPYVGAMLSLLHKRPPRLDDADNPVRWAMGAAAPREIWEAVERRFALRIVETYGQTELAGNWLMPPPEGTRVGTVGKPPARFEARVAGEDGREVPAGVAGELQLRPSGPHLFMEGYYKQPEATVEAWVDSWYRTGDRLSRDADGYFTYHGRLKDFVRRRGENVSTFEIERAVGQHPAVLECAALGVPSELGEEEVLLCVVTRHPCGESVDGETGQRVTPQAIYRFCLDRLPSFMVPRYVRVLDRLPKTATARVRKFALAEQGLSGAWDSRAWRVTPRQGARGPRPR
jgi:crotonobetaine/carnitine-CoA ligase